MGYPILAGTPPSTCLRTCSGYGPNQFGITVGGSLDERSSMGVETTDIARRAVEETGAPRSAPRERLDARDLGPPKPLKQTLERLTELDDGTVLVQLNDRAPQHLYPKLDDRGYAYGTVELDAAVVTVVWTP
jgi:hypothetical protein